ncbi:MFS sugar transporter [Kalaharituber pfeilii]|nr:MFS sugar transporter [Kalaharituber pfeilii]
MTSPAAARTDSPASTSSNDVSHEKQADPITSAPQGTTSGAGTSSLRRKSTQRSTAAELALENVNARLANPLAGYTHAELQEMGEAYAREHGMEDLVDEFRKGACLAQNPKGYDSVPGLTEEDEHYLSREYTHKWSHPGTLYFLVVMCSVAAAVQGMDETVINGANLFFRSHFGIAEHTERNEWILGVVNSAPYFSCALVACWLTDPLNRYLGRRGTIFVTCAISCLTCLWQGFVNSWWHLLIARFFLGFGIGPKSSTVPVYAAECAPPAIRGALVMMWQMWTAFGIMLGFIADVAFYNVHSDRIQGLNWRMMLASAMVPPIIVCAQVYFCPESPRWYMLKGNHRRAFDSLARLRWTPVQAARDIFYMHTLLEAEKEIKSGRNRFIELFTVGRNRRAMIGSEIVMFMQQFCGINVIAYYSAVIFETSGFTSRDALLASMGFGIINFLFAIPAVYTIDTFGRRNLLLTTFPLMSLFLFFTGFSFWIPDTTSRLACIALGIYLFSIVYSPGEGPVPFTYSAEAYPLYVRDLGMSLATATTWFFNGILSITWPRLLRAFKPQGAFAYYGTWNIIGWLLVLCFVPETKGLSLEELDQVFSVPTRVHATWGLRQVPYFVNRYLLRRDVKKEVLYRRDDDETEVHEAHGKEGGELEVDPEKRV